MTPTEKFRSGLVSLVGRPNSGKSTLLNQLVGQKISITSRRPQTTRHQILGIKNTDSTQTVFVDTPGLHDDVKKAINRYMNRSARTVLEGIDCVVMMVQAPRWNAKDDYVLRCLERVECPVILVINKVDRLNRKSDVMPLINEVKEKYKFTDIVPISAKTGANIDRLYETILSYLPEQPAIYPVDTITDRDDVFIISETIREQIFRRFGQEIPYVTTVTIEKYQIKNGLAEIGAVVWVEKSGQKAILIGNKGQSMKQIGQEARKQLEKFLGCKVFLQIWVKVKSGWSDDSRLLSNFGYRQMD